MPRALLVQGLLFPHVAQGKRSHAHQRHVQRREQSHAPAYRGQVRQAGGIISDIGGQQGGFQNSRRSRSVPSTCRQARPGPRPQSPTGWCAGSGTRNNWAAARSRRPWRAQEHGIYGPARNNAGELHSAPRTGAPTDTWPSSPGPGPARSGVKSRMAGVMACRTPLPDIRRRTPEESTDHRHAQMAPPTK